MDRTVMINAFAEREFKEKFIIEPEYRLNLVRDRLSRALEMYKPAVTVKAGIGSGELLLQIAEHSFCVCIDPSEQVIREFTRKFGNDPRFSKVRLINGNFSSFPIDYYKADMLVCVDNFDIIQSGISMDEFKRAIQFEGYLFFAGVVLSDEDVEGVCDELFRMINPLHNDYYLAGDLKTFMHLKDFTVIADEVQEFRFDLLRYAAYWRNVPGIEQVADDEEIKKFIQENRELLSSLYGMDDSFNLNELYCVGLFRKNRYKDTSADPI